MTQRLILLLLLCAAPLFAGPLDDIKNVNSIFDKGIKVDLRSPTFKDGVLSTEQGGVITGPNIRIQARNLVYTKNMVEGKPVLNVVAENDVALEFGTYFFVGERLEYDFMTHYGVIYEARSSLEPWYFGGRAIELHPDGSYSIFEGYITTSENYKTDWQITADKAVLKDNSLFSAENVQFKLLELPVFWLPKFNANLNSIFDNPIRYNITWGGRQHTRLEMQYELFSWNRLRNFVRLDYRIKRGFGGGFYTLYSSEDHKENFEMVNYIARDSAVEKPSERTRYRFQGVYDKSWDDDHKSIFASWDKLSDEYMATDYDDRDLDIETAGKTMLQLRRQHGERWIGNMYTRVRVNNFQTIKQELPSLELNFKPFTLGSTGIISENVCKFSYLDFQYAKHSKNVHNFNSTRLEFNHKIYRSYKTGIFITTPQIGALAVNYGSNPHSSDHWVTLGSAEIETTTYLRKRYSSFNHVIRPYARYKFYTMPGVIPSRHYIFDINDGWYKLNMATLGVDNSLYAKGCNQVINRPLSLNLFAHAFFDTKTIYRTIPKIYAQMTWNSFPTLQHVFTVGWDTQRKDFDHFNFLNAWTVNDNTAFTLEWRHRESWDWRKADYTNFILDAFRSEDQLRHSQLSDRRDTLLFHIFHRIHPNWAIEFESRHGWNRIHEPNYSEYEIDLLGTIQTALNIKFSFQRKEYDRNDNRFAIYFNVGLPKPSLPKDDIIPTLNF